MTHELAGIYFEASGRAARLGQILDLMPGLRNRVKGHSWTLSPDQHEKHARELLATVTQYLACLEGRISLPDLPAARVSAELGAVRLKLSKLLDLELGHFHKAESAKLVSNVAPTPCKPAAADPSIN